MFLYEKMLRKMESLFFFFLSLSLSPFGSFSTPPSLTKLNWLNIFLIFVVVKRCEASGNYVFTNQYYLRFSDQIFPPEKYELGIPF